MRRALNSFLTFSLVVVAACAQTEGTNVEGTGGSNGSGTGGSGNGTGGSTGGSSTGGNGTGGASPGTGGTHTGGTIGTGGTTGAAGRGGTTGTAGSTGKGGTTGSGGTTGAGTGGAATGGAGGAHVGSGGTAGSGPSTGTGGSGQGSLFTIMVQLASAVKSTAPTTVGIVTWSISASGITSAHIDFGLDTSYGMTAPVDLTVAMYRTLLLGMKPAKTYHFRITASDGTSTYTSNDQTVTTGAKLSSTPLTSFSVKNAASLPKGFFITSFWQGTGSKVPFIFDTDGDVVWWYTAASSESTDGISRARMSADSQSIWLVNESLSGNPLRRVTIDGLTTQTYSNTKSSHDIAAVTADTMAYLDYSESDCNSIFEINNAGTFKEVFEPSGVTGPGTSFPSCHGNSVRYSKKEDFYTYSDWQEDVAVVNRAGTLQWLLSKKVSGGHTAWGGQQHGTQLLDSSILIFANMGTAGKSQAVEYGLDGHLIKAFSANGGSNVTNFGDVQRLSNGNTIITYSTSSLMQEVDASDSVVLEVKGSGSFGYVEFRDSLYGPPLDIAQ
jgi:hypothetical protein